MKEEKRAHGESHSGVACAHVKLSSTSYIVGPTHRHTTRTHTHILDSGHTLKTERIRLRRAIASFFFGSSPPPKNAVRDVPLERRLRLPLGARDLPEEGSWSQGRSARGLLPRHGGTWTCGSVLVSVVPIGTGSPELDAVRGGRARLQLV